MNDRDQNTSHYSSILIDDEEQKNVDDMYKDLLMQRSKDGFSKRLPNFDFSDSQKYVEHYKVFIDATKKIVLKHEFALQDLLEDPNHSVTDEARLKAYVAVLRAQRHTIKVIIRERLFIALLDQKESELKMAAQEIRILRGSLKAYRDTDTRRLEEAREINPIINSDINKTSPHASLTERTNRLRTVSSKERPTSRIPSLRSNQYATSLSENVHSVPMSREKTSSSLLIRELLFPNEEASPTSKSPASNRDSLLSPTADRRITLYKNLALTETAGLRARNFDTTSSTTQIDGTTLPFRRIPQQPLTIRQTNDKTIKNPQNPPTLIAPTKDGPTLCSTPQRPVPKPPVRLVSVQETTRPRSPSKALLKSFYELTDNNTIFDSKAIFDPTTIFDPQIHAPTTPLPVLTNYEKMRLLEKRRKGISLPQDATFAHGARTTAENMFKNNRSRYNE